MITIVFGPPRFGKTCFMTHQANMIMFDRERNRAMQAEIIRKQNSGFTSIKTIPVHCVAANYDITGKRFRYRPRYSRRINPFRLGFKNEFVKTHFDLPFECIFITEAQKYLNSRLSMYFPDWQSRWYEQHGHNDLDIFLDTQRPMLIDVNVRELSQFVEIVKLTRHRDKFGRIQGLTWKIRRIDNSPLFERYMASGKTDKSCYTEEEVHADYNVFECYNSQSCKPKFYDGHFNEDFDYLESEPQEETREAYIAYLQKFDDELPKDYFQKRKVA